MICDVYGFDFPFFSSKFFTPPNRQKKSKKSVIVVVIESFIRSYYPSNLIQMSVLYADEIDQNTSYEGDSKFSLRESNYCLGFI